MFNTIKKQYDRLSREIARSEKMISKLPKGNIIAEQRGNKFRYYLNTKEKRRCLTRDDDILKEQLALKNLLRVQIEDMLSEKIAIEYYLRHHKQEKTPGYLLSHPGIAALLQSYLEGLDTDFKIWASSGGGHDMYPENKIFKAENGEYVRSKSELIIVSQLIRYELSFRYESALMLGSVCVHPDFTIKHPVTGETIIWEHLGLIDDPEYARIAAEKIRMYIMHGYYPGINLILTCETADKPFDSLAAVRAIELYLNS